MNDFPSFNDEVTTPTAVTPPPASTQQMPPQQGQFIPPTPAPVPVPRIPLTPQQKKRRLLIIIGVLSVVVLLAAGFIFATIVNHNRTPEAQVRSYLSAISAGKADQANSIVDPGIANGDRAFLNDDVLKNADQRIEVLDIHELSSDEIDQRRYGIIDSLSANLPTDVAASRYLGDNSAAVVEATYSLDGVHHSSYFIATPGKNEKLILHTWNIKTPLIRSVTVNTKLPGISIGNTDAEVEQDSYRTKIYVYPGIYTITESSDSKYLAAKETLSVNSKNEYIDMDAQLTDAAENLVLDTVKKQYDRCSSIEGNLDQVCPYAVRNKNLEVLEPVTPITTIEHMGDYDFTSGQGTIRIKPNPTPFNEDPEAKEIEFVFEGYISIEKGEPKVKLYNARAMW
ncbi:hypothetical protein [Arcanobacterium phocae]|uniref:hypothetical protein n=1 Tax=Arcanobacterium phocae TaxID=131112 RepID=UPI001C0F2DC2|nr:hypothetical protein [Arcanobacterium phocae]